MEITIYELLGLIKDNKIPKKIKYKNKIWKYDNENKDYISFTDDGKYYNFLFNEIDFLEKLNDEIKIIEKNKEIKTLDINFENTNDEVIYLEFENKINELIDEINNLKEK